jgi:phospholipase C
MVIASPWSRGGWVNSEVFDHTSSIQFLEKFLSQKFGKKIEEPNISSWRRTVCGDLTSVFRPYNDEALSKPAFLDRNEFIESIHKARFKKPPSNYKKLAKKEIEQINQQPHSSSLMAAQEQGVRSSSAIPYELYADGKLSDDKTSFEISMKAGNDIFGESSAGSAFSVYAPGKYKNESVRTWAYAVAVGDELKDNWAVDQFEKGRYHLRVYGPNGFFREFSGNKNDGTIDVSVKYELADGKPTGNLVLKVINKTIQPQHIVIVDNSYKAGIKEQSIDAGSSKEMPFDTSKSFGWYDVSIKLKGNLSFENRYAGRVETGLASKTDPLMGRMI